MNDLCEKGRIPGAVKDGGRWQISDEAIKPEDGRISSSRYVKTRGQEKLRSLPIGISDYAHAQSEYYYVDKTLLIKEFLDKRQEAKLEELREWYDGYRFGSTEIYNPWSVANYFIMTVRRNHIGPIPVIMRSSGKS